MSGEWPAPEQRDGTGPGGEELALPPPPPPPARLQRRPRPARPAAPSDRLDPTRANDDDRDHTADGWRRTGRHTVGAEPAPTERGQDERAGDEVAASDVEWGEPVWSDDAGLSSPPPTAVDWRKSIPREFVARTNVNPRAEPTNGHSRAAAPTPAAEQDDGTAADTAARHVGVNGANGTAQRQPDAPTGGGDTTGAGANAIADEDTADPRPPQHAVGATTPGPANPATGPTAAPSGLDDSSPWNELDREIARALAATLAGKLARYVHSPILPLVADELTRLLNSPPPLGNARGTRRSVEPEGEADADADDTGERLLPADDRPRHFGDGHAQ